MDAPTILIDSNQATRAFLPNLWDDTDDANANASASNVSAPVSQSQTELRSESTQGLHSLPEKKHAINNEKVGGAKTDVSPSRPISSSTMVENAGQNSGSYDPESTEQYQETNGEGFVPGATAGSGLKHASSTTSLSLGSLGNSNKNGHSNSSTSLLFSNIWSSNNQMSPVPRSATPLGKNSLVNETSNMSNPNSPVVMSSPLSFHPNVSLSHALTRPASLPPPSVSLSPTMTSSALSGQGYRFGNESTVNNVNQFNLKSPSLSRFHAQHTGQPSNVSVSQQQQQQYQQYHQLQQLNQQQQQPQYQQYQSYPLQMNDSLHQDVNSHTSAHSPRPLQSSLHLAQSMSNMRSQYTSSPTPFSAGSNNSYSNYNTAQGQGSSQLSYSSHSASTSNLAAMDSMFSNNNPTVNMNTTYNDYQHDSCAGSPYLYLQQQNNQQQQQQRVGSSNSFNSSMDNNKGFDLGSQFHKNPSFSNFVGLRDDLSNMSLNGGTGLGLDHLDPYQVESAVSPSIGGDGFANNDSSTSNSGLQANPNIVAPVPKSTINSSSMHNLVESNAGKSLSTGSASARSASAMPTLRSGNYKKSVESNRSKQNNNSGSINNSNSNNTVVSTVSTPPPTISKENSCSVTDSPSIMISSITGQPLPPQTQSAELYKTELCSTFMKKGYCPYENKCQFAHGEHELNFVSRPSNWRSKPCVNWVKTGTCSYNDRCCFKHD
ncbi:hypothetical protein NADFUDRAFT_81875 [Nadsonia fulvescens var. elongata DSM 6958]|uniref:C3H1-type domain-containing protein n=1 Tax=Nadsonia fulvescens var. elongata DSM 6958 TaxID=857566 RepID=A0A1E3PPM0_9ASCO|nr:hypothetical protein NADFUDRAFT_81875 [Nadsonia fulvescens var. elongata DSM 6958]